MSYPFFTILTATLNNSAPLIKNIESIRYQSFQDFEHIIIDGGSRDETLDILKKYENTYNLTWISESDHGIADALNKGLRRTRGRYVLVIHADDQLVSSNILGKVYPVLRDELFDIYSFPVILDHHNYGKVLLKPIRVVWWYHFKTIFLHQGTFVHRRVYNRIGGFREQFAIALDYDFFYRGLMCRSTVSFEKHPIALMGGSGISNNQDLLTRRLEEEVRVQDLNETNPFWRVARSIFRTVYFPYKTRLLPRLRNDFGKK